MVAGLTDSFEVFLWLVQTEKLLDIMAGHTAPVGSLAFSPSGVNQLVGGLWDKTVQAWSIFGHSGAVEPFLLSSDQEAQMKCVQFSGFLLLAMLNRAGLDCYRAMLVMLDWLGVGCKLLYHVISEV